ncbi:hypothetical protein XcvCFBP7112P_22725 (plasmid) [Xanthomonas citri pv. vignicola]|nr:hypothetical protein XcvCFBP7112P_22725 [Xanthomonas citri pv. vignicola]
MGGPIAFRLLKEFIMAMKVFMHTRSPQRRDWLNEEREFGRIPMIGEYVAGFGEQWNREVS